MRPVALAVVCPWRWICSGATGTRRVVVDPADFPHALPPLPALLARLGGVVQVLTDPLHPSAVELPIVGDRCAVDSGHSSSGTPTAGQACAPLPVPDLTRG